MSPNGDNKNLPDSEGDVATTEGAPSRPSRRGDENLPDSEGDASAAETGREASPPSRVQAVSIRWEAPLPPPAARMVLIRALTSPSASRPQCPAACPETAPTSASRGEYAVHGSPRRAASARLAIVLDTR